MAKRTLYAAAQRAASLAAVALTVFPASTRAGTSRQDAACAACVAIAVDAPPVSSLPQRLEGVEVFVRVPARKAGEADLALNEVERRGGRLALFIDGLPESALPAAVARRAGRIVIDPGLQPRDLTENQ